MPTKADLTNAQTALITATTNLDTAVKNKNNIFASMSSWWDALNDCDKDFWRVSDMPYLGHKYIGDCKACLPYSPIKVGLCKCRGSCCSKDTCEANRKTYNDIVDYYVKATSDLATATTNFNTAKTNLNIIVEAIKNSPEGQALIAAAEEEQKKQTIKWIFFGLAVLVIIGVAFFFLRRTVKT